MMKTDNAAVFTVLSVERLTGSVYRMTLSGDTRAITAPGQFVNIRLDGFFLRRPISVCDLEGDTLTLVFKTVGKGTDALSRLNTGAKLDLLTGLGNGFDTGKCGSSPLLIGGGVGTPPLFLLAKRLIAAGKSPTVILGFNTADEIIMRGEFERLCGAGNVTVTTADGSGSGCVKGFVTAAMTVLNYDSIFACGPEPMLRAVFEASGCPGQYSFEERMGCGFGACMGCSCKTVTGYKRICKDGPVLEREEILW